RVTGGALPRLMVLDDREGLVRYAPGMALLRERCRVTVLAQRLDPDELLDSDVVPADGALGWVRGASPR
ncbi:MAG: hypothetical protein ACRDOZ_02120, partial [Nocardioides sp.]